MSKLIIICGPTSTGKTSLGIKLCRKFDGEIISADSRQLFKYMDIGTGKKPAVSRMKGTVPFNTVGEGFWKVGGVYIHLYDVVEPDRKFSVARFKDAATKEIESIWRRGKTPFLVGGTGFYIAAVLGETEFPRVPPDWELRRELEKLSTEELFEKLQKLDPERAKTIDPKNPRRLIRAIEIAADSPTRRVENSKPDGFFLGGGERVLKIGLTAPREVLYDRADRWAEAIINNGLLEEVQDLINRGYRDAEPLKGIIYQTAVDHLDGEITKEETLQKIKFDLHGYIRRQLTWFKRDKEIKWFDLTESDLEKKVEKMVKSYLK
jgi:tRNA dimethylallyltransferase